MTTIQGVIHGKTIELNEAPCLPDGEAVVVTIERAATPASVAPAQKSPQVEDWIDRLVFDSSVPVGGRIVKGTRLSAEAIVREIAVGRGDDELLASNPGLTAEDLKALRQFAKLPEAFRLTFGAWWEDGEELERYVESLRQRRRRGRLEIPP
jgi:uncharacterized protein (DUF433 family)